MSEFICRQDGKGYWKISTLASKKGRRKGLRGRKQKKRKKGKREEK